MVGLQLLPDMADTWPMASEPVTPSASTAAIATPAIE
jgi:hypothetical protein